MPAAFPLLTDVLDRARADWLAGDAEAWRRYTDGLARLQHHLAAVRTADRHPEVSARRGTDRPAVRVRGTRA